MGKSIYMGLTPKDHPMFSGGPELFSPPAYRRSSTTTPKAADGATLTSRDSVQQEVKSDAVPLDLCDIVKDLNDPEPDIEMLTTMFRCAIENRRCVMPSPPDSIRGEGNSPDVGQLSQASGKV